MSQKTNCYDTRVFLIVSHCFTTLYWYTFIKESCPLWKPHYERLWDIVSFKILFCEFSWMLLDYEQWTVLPCIRSIFPSRCNILRLHLSLRVPLDLRFSATLRLLKILSIPCFYGFYYPTESAARIDRGIISSSVEKKSHCWTAMICCHISNNSICYCDFHSKTCKTVLSCLVARDKLAYGQS